MLLFHFTLKHLSDLSKASEVSVSMLVLVPSALLCQVKHLGSYVIPYHGVYFSLF